MRSRSRAIAGAAALASLLSAAGCDTPTHHATPRPDHIVVVVEENHSYGDIIGNPQAPYLNELAGRGASLTEFYAISHPSQPNYISLFSGSGQGVSGDSCPFTSTAQNLGSRLLQAGLTFGGYAQSMPQVGFTGCTSGAYVRRHNPWVAFSNLPSSVNRPWTRFPRDYTRLPTVSFVVPDVDHDMHNGSVRTADTWLRDNLDAYARWAAAHNSLLVVTWDESSDADATNHIPTIIVGAHVRPGAHTQPNNLFGLLRMLLDAYGLKSLDHSAEADPIDVWKTSA